MIRSHLMAGACLPCLLLAQPTFARDDNVAGRTSGAAIHDLPDETSDVVVTALKRPQTVQDVPASVTT